MASESWRHASRRERQVLDVLHRRGPSTAAEIRAELDDPPTYSAVRALLRVLEEKGGVTHAARGRAYVYRVVASPAAARRDALRHVVKTFFGGAPEEAAAALLDLSGGEIDAATRRRLHRRIAAARREGR
jgi:BlaI family penicillinase repressor